MSDSSEGSPGAAQRAQPDPASPPAPADTSTGESGWSALVSRFLSARPRPEADAPQSAMEKVSEAGAREMLINLGKMRDMRVEDVAVPRADIVAIGQDAPLDEIMQVYRDSGFTRLPVYDDTLDDPRGFLHLKDLTLRYGFGADSEGVEIEPLLRRILFVPPSMPLGALLQRMQNTRIHIALVIDEYGGVDGLVTIEDLLEEIVGEIEDEHDTEEAKMWREESPGVYIVNARAELTDFEEVAGVDLLSDKLDEEVDTMGGLVFMLIGRIPERAEVIAHPDGHEFEVVDADARRVKRMRVRIAQGDQQAAAE
ncbi:hemolysin family protein [Roseobacter sp. HKCCA0434]|uniref:hemolysin family protein n=1 Tax=Roseobacter sp. HKCCA0434 TaxID=3079297 RepID=UPI002905E3E7|nr:hemolysin family protein [Roseobacter sp. HKCCA0434]